MKKIIIYMGFMIAALGVITPFLDPIPEVQVEVAEVATPEPVRPLKKAKVDKEEPKKELTVQPKVVAQEAPESPEEPETGVESNETLIWNYLTAYGFTREQSAGIMGNLKQEHNFQTHDTPNGMGIAQWIGNRRLALLQRASNHTLDAQLQFMMYEFKTTERQAFSAIKSANTVEEATIAFQNLYERCGNCMQGTRIQYAYDILGRY